MLPKPGDGFEWVDVAGRPALVCRALAVTSPHFFTTRDWPFGSPAASDGWGELTRAAGVTRVLRVRQVHGADAVVVRRGEPPFDAPPAADIIVSDDPSSAIAVQAADCVPLLVADSRAGVVAAAHAGWRGLAAGVPAAAVATLARLFGSRPADLVAAVGPSIGACCYQVGADVREQFAEGFGGAATTWFHDAPAPVDGNRPFRELTPTPGKWFFDAWAAARDQLEDAGLPPHRIHVASLCTASHPQVFCSYRRDGAAAGRMLGVIRARV
jgi:YfiH family protein